MKLAPLQLDHYHFTSLSILARENINIQESEHNSVLYPKFEQNDIKTTISLGEPENETDPHQFVVLLNIFCDPEKNSTFPYSFAASLEGVFTITHTGPLEERKKLVVCNGASMLYGAAREVLLSLSARQKYGAMLLPSANFNGMGPDSLSDKKQIPPPARQARKRPSK